MYNKYFKSNIFLNSWNRVLGKRENSEGERERGKFRRIDILVWVILKGFCF